MGWVVASLKGFKLSRDVVGFLQWLAKVEERPERQDRRFGAREEQAGGLGKAGSRSRGPGMDGRGS